VLVSLGATFFAGLLTFASPCILPLVPVYLSVLGGSAVEAPTSRASAAALRRAGLGFALGLAIVFVLLGASASAAAGLLSAHRTMLLTASGALMVLFGLKLTGLLRIGRLDAEARPFLSRLPQVGGFRGGVLFGGAFALGWTPCVGPVLGSVLTYTAARDADPWTGAAYLGTYAAGLALPLVAAAFAARAVLPWLQRARAHTAIVQRATGVVLLGVGALMLADRLVWLAPPADAPVAASTSEEPACHGDCACGAEGCATDLPEGAPADPDAAIVGAPRLVEFVSGHCAVCAKMAPIVREVEARCAGDGDAIARIDVDAPEGRALAARYAVRVVPTFLSVDAEGHEVARLVGEQEAARLSRAVEETRGARCAASL
jgi:cytochrome c-type biogenesis protein